MTSSPVATASIIVNATPSQIWSAITTPESVKKFMFGVDVVSDWQQGGSLIYKGEWDGNTFEDHGTILEIKPGKLLKTTYFSGSSGLADKPENYNVVTYELTPSTDDTTKVTVTQTNNPDQDAADRASSNWGMTLTSLKELLEK